MKRPKVRRDILEAAKTVSRMDMDDANLETPKTLKLEPHLQKFLTEKLDPKCAESKILIFDPKDDIP